MKRMVDEKEVVKDIEAVEGGIKVLQLDGTSKTVPVSGSGGSVDWDDIQNKPNFATVATTGDYDDLTDKPSIPAAQVNSDWNAVSGVAQILNKPVIPDAVSGTNDGTNWTSLTIGSDTYGIGGGGSTLIAGDGIDITNNVISEKVPIYPEIVAAEDYTWDNFSYESAYWQWQDTSASDFPEAWATLTEKPAQLYIEVKLITNSEERTYSGNATYTDTSTCLVDLNGASKLEQLVDQNNNDLSGLFNRFAITTDGYGAAFVGGSEVTSITYVKITLPSHTIYHKVPKEYIPELELYTYTDGTNFYNESGIEWKTSTDQYNISGYKVKVRSYDGSGNSFGSMTLNSDGLGMQWELDDYNYMRGTYKMNLSNTRARTVFDYRGFYGFGGNIDPTDHTVALDKSGEQFIEAILSYFRNGNTQSGTIDLIGTNTDSEDDSTVNYGIYLAQNQYSEISGIEKIENDNIRITKDTSNNTYEFLVKNSSVYGYAKAYFKLQSSGQNNLYAYLSNNTAPTPVKQFSAEAIKIDSSLDVNDNHQLFVKAEELDFSNLPTSDPQIAGRLWNDNGTLKISSGI